MSASEVPTSRSASESVQLFSSRSTDYARFRPTYPDALFTWLASQCAATDTVLDLAAGNGQASAPLTKHFHRVLACDASAEQLKAGDDWSDVQRFVADAHYLPLRGGQLDLLVVAQALHWFATPAFFTQARLALKPNGLFCAWCYSLLEVSAEVNAVIHRLYRETLAGYWPAGRSSVDAGYSDIQPPFPLIESPPFALEAHWSLAELIGYLRTWSAVKQWQQQHGRDPVALIEPQLSSAWGPADQRRLIRWPLHLLTGFPNR
ncbi:class I SAM-dependent methyltransferase [Stutzerimonas stutzeri]|nr:class I SAM-dependent methyltransferase [Stutzerimonas stutzeri]